MNIKNLKPTEIYVYPKTRNEAIECFTLFEKMGFKNDHDYQPCSDSSFYIEENRIRFGWHRHPTLTEITLSELRQMAGVEEIKPTVFDLMDSEGSELAALRKENEELREFVWRVNTICSALAMPTEKQVDEMLMKSKNILKP